MECGEFLLTNEVDQKLSASHKCGSIDADKVKTCISTLNNALLSKPTAPPPPPPPALNSQPIFRKRPKSAISRKPQQQQNLFVELQKALAYVHYISPYIFLVR